MLADAPGSGKNGDRDAAAVRANRPMPSSCGIYYFEIEIVSKGQSGYIGVGFSALNVILSRLPGWEANSWGYHGDDGHSFSSQGTGRSYGPTFSTGDIVGCGLDFSCGRAFFTKNGVQLGHVFDNLPYNTTQLYPSVGLRTPGEIVRGNFGQRPFRYDIDHFVRLRRDEIRQSMMESAISERYLLKPAPAAPVPDEPRWPANVAEPDVEADGLVHDTAAELIASYLSYHGHVETARAFERQRAEERRTRSRNLGFGPIASAELDALVASTSAGAGADGGLGASERQTVCAAILSGDAAGALLTIRQRFPKALPSIERALRRHIFVELVVALAASDGDAMDEDASAGSDEDARAAMLEYGRSLDAAYGSTDPDLRATFGLLACVDPAAERPDLAGDEARRRLAEQVNAAILSASAPVAECADERSLARTVRSAAVGARVSPSCGEHVHAGSARRRSGGAGQPERSSAARLIAPALKVRFLVPLFIAGRRHCAGAPLSSGGIRALLIAPSRCSALDGYDSLVHACTAPLLLVYCLHPVCPGSASLLPLSSRSTPHPSASATWPTLRCSASCQSATPRTLGRPRPARSRPMWRPTLR